MRSIKGITPSLVVCANPSPNLFVARFDKVEVQLRQPRRKDSGRCRLAWADLSEKSKRRYRRANVDKQLYDMKYRCQLPLYRGWVPGWLPLIMETDNTIVAFVDIMFKTGDSEFKKFLIKPEETGMACSIGVLDKYQGLGFGTAYSFLTDEIGRHFGINWILGSTYAQGGMRNIRIADNWEKIREYRAPSGEIMIDHRLRLK